MSNTEVQSKAELKARMRFADLKKVVHDNNNKVTEWLDALLTIRDEQLYLFDGKKTWEDWCRENCDQSFRTVQRLVAKQRSSRLRLQNVIQHYDEVVVDNSAQTPDNKKEDTKVKPKEATTVTPKPKGDVVVDEVGNELKWEARKNWLRRDEVSEVVNEASSFRNWLQATLNPRDPLWHEINFAVLEARVEEVIALVKSARPYAICTECNGAPQTRGGRCAFCGNKGLISKMRWETMVAEEKKAILLKSAKKSS